ncbi:SDR family oxidoreductase [Pseudazoarcus pumilus]|uniref:NAD(P)-dependent oxidoreductase n=1 Tax=Pseudazoarcus pumilus TaxID=2067960 RepID=A0A2I6S3V6_9RHOO|nr:SDR family oxidoreductase [Pseudazoarcus pumilus]AUN93936.1 NAD(P)-dependent oxidoreductase [Pseudazoarcus pumilus]
MNRILIVGAGDVAGRAIPWLAKRFEVFALARRSEAFARLRALGAIPLAGDLDGRASLARVAGLADAVLHCAPPPREGADDARTAHLLAALGAGRSLPQRIVYISTTGVYGDCAGARIDETRAPCPSSARAVRRVAAERRLREFGVRHGVAVSILRAPGIYAAERLPLERLRRGDPVPQGAHDPYTNHIHADDLARMACLTLFRGAPGRVYNAVDLTDLRMGEYFDLAARMFGLPPPPRATPDELAERLSSMALSFLSESRRISGARALRELRMRLTYPTVADGFAAALSQGVSAPC